MKQYELKLPLTAYALVINNQGKKFGMYPLTSAVPELFPTRKEARNHKLRHEDIVKVTIRPTPPCK